MSKSHVKSVRFGRFGRFTAPAAQLRKNVLMLEMAFSEECTSWQAPEPKSNFRQPFHPNWGGVIILIPHTQAPPRR